jgi:hypothetical protein
MARNKEGIFQDKLLKRLEELFPGCIVMKNDSSYIQGIPDLTILYKDRWAVLECKKSKNEPHRPNQDYYVGLLDSMSYSSFIFPENMEEVLNELQQAFGTRGPSRVSRS